MANNLSILKTIIYSDIFDFPLTKEEIWKFLIGKKISRESFEKELKSLEISKAAPLGCSHKFYYFLGREKIVETRIRNKKISKKKLKISKKIIEKLSLVPTVLFIGISGGLSMENADEKDDIDLFVISSKGNIWITRLILILLLLLMGQYRGREKKESGKVCLNMLIDEEFLTFSKSRHDLYTAHEIIQLKPIFNRNDTYKKFVNANRRWVDVFLPNAKFKYQESKIKKKRSLLFMFHNSLFIFEKLSKILQLWYMRKHITTETISDHFLAFHPYEYKNYVLKEYNRRLKKYEI